MKKTKIATAFYDENNGSRAYGQFSKKQAAIFFNRIQDIVAPRKISKILDVACGLGDLDVIFRDKFNVKAYGMDLSSSAVKIARKKGVKAIKHDLERKWPYRNDSFDLVLASQIIEHVYNPDNLIKEAKRVLRKGGLLIIATPNLAFWLNRLIFVFGYQPFFSEVSVVDKTIGLDFTRSLTTNRKPVGHLRVFSLKSLIDILLLHGFEIVGKRGLEVAFFPKYLGIFDKFFRFFPDLATNIVVIARIKR